MTNNTEPTSSWTGLSMVDLLVLVLRHRRWIVGLPFLTIVVVLVVTLAGEREYSSEASFFPQATQTQSGGLSTLAAQFGLSVPSSEGQSPQFYADLLRSRALLTSTVAHSYELEPGASTAPVALVDILAPGDRDLALRNDRAVRRLDRLLSTSTDPGTGVISFTVAMRSPILAQQVVDRMLTLVNEFNLEQRQSQARSERTFVQTRLAESQVELRQAEDTLQRFLSENRAYTSSPALVFAHDRLKRRVARAQQIEGGLAEALEKARIEEVRNTPVITIVEPAQAPVRPDSRHVVLRVALAGLVGVLLGLFIALTRGVLENSRRDDPVRYAALEAEGQQLSTGMLHSLERIPLLGQRLKREGSDETDSPG